MKNIGCSLFFIFACCFPVAMSYAQNSRDLPGVGVDRTRVIYYEKSGAKGVSVTFNNNSDNVYLLQSFITPPNSLVLSPSALKQVNSSKAPFFVAPPLVRLDAHSRHVLRLIKKKGDLPDDRESVFLLVAKVIPNTPKSARSERSGEMILTLSTILKVFYRPASLPEGDLTSIAKQLGFYKTDGKLVVKNPSPFYLTLAGIEVGGKMLAIDGDKYWMVPPLTEMSYTLPKGMIGPVRVSFLNEDGESMPWMETNINCTGSC